MLNTLKRLATGPLSTRQYWLVLAAILLLATVTRFYQLAQPTSYMFDEVYHAVTAKLIARGDPRAFEWWNSPVEPNTAVDWLHPPLAKYTQALGMLVFGENSFGWRVSSAIFGVLVVGITAILVKEVFHHQWMSLLAALLVSWDGLLLTQSRIAMNDIHVTFFILLTCLCYWRYRQTKNQKPTWLLGNPQLAIVTGLAAGLAISSKWSGVFSLGIIGLSELSRLWPRWRQAWQRGDHWLWLRTSSLLALLWLVVPFMIYVGSYGVMFGQGKSLICTGPQVQQGVCYCSQTSSGWVTTLGRFFPTAKPTFEAWEARGGCKRLISHFSELHHQIWWYQTTLKATHSYQSRPWQWFLNWRPVWFHVQYQDGGQIANVYALGNPLLLWLGGLSAVVTLLWLTTESQLHWLERHGLSKLTPALGFITLGYFLVWLPWQLSPRIMFFYHYTPAVPFLAILLAFWLVTIWGWAKKRPGTRLCLALLLAAIGVVFALWYPNWTAIAVPSWWANQVYFSLPNWK